MDNVSEPITEGAEFLNWPIYAYGNGNLLRVVISWSVAFGGGFVLLYVWTNMYENYVENLFVRKLADLLDIAIYVMAIVFILAFRLRIRYSLESVHGDAIKCPKSSLWKLYGWPGERRWIDEVLADRVVIRQNTVGEVFAWARFADPAEGYTRWQTFLGRQRIEIHLKPDLAPDLRDDALSVLLDGEVFTRPWSRRKFMSRQAS